MWAVLLLMASLPALVLAQTPKDFFDQDFVNRGQSSRSPAVADERPPLVKSREAAPASQPTQAAESQTAAPLGPVKPAVAGNYPAYKVKWLGAVLNSLDTPHFQAGLDELVRAAIAHDFMLHEVYAIGRVPEQAAIDRLLPKLAIRGGALKIKAAAPPEYKVSRSPAWLIGTDSGMFILEATGALEDCFNSKHEFVDKFALRRELIVPLEPTPVASVAAEEATVLPSPTPLPEPTMTPTLPPAGGDSF